MNARFSQRGTLAVVCLATAMLMLDIAVVNTALPHIASDLHSGLTGVQWVVDAYTLALATVVLTAGSLADRLGRRRVFAWGMAVFTASSLACALADSVALLDGARAIQGIAAASSAAMLGASAHASEDTVNTAIPQTKIRRRPKRSESEPALSTAVASASV